MVKSLLKILYTLLESPLSLRLFHVSVIARLFHLSVIANAIIAIPFTAGDFNLVLLLLIVNSRVGIYFFSFMKFLPLKTKKDMSAILLANGNQ